MNLVLSPEAITGRNLKFHIGELVHRRVLEHCDQPVHDHTSNLGHLQIPPGDLKEQIFFKASDEIILEGT